MNKELTSIRSQDKGKAIDTNRYSKVFAMGYQIPRLHFHTGRTSISMFAIDITRLSF